MGEKEQGGMLRVVVVLGLIAMIAAIVIFATVKLSTNMKDTTSNTKTNVSKSIKDATAVTDTYNPDPSHGINDSDSGFGYQLNGGSKTAMITSANRSKTPSDITLPSYVESDGVKYTVTSIAGGVFAGYPVKSIVIPQTVTSIGDGAFNYSTLESVTLNDGLESIGNGAFAGSKLTEVTIPSSVKTIGQSAFDGNVKQIKE